MLVPVSVQYSNESQPRTRLAIVLRHVDFISDVEALRDSLLDVMSTCLSSDENKNNTDSFSLWSLNTLIGELARDCQQAEKGGQS